MPTPRCTETGCANRGLDIDLDLSGQLHYGGRANQDENGDCYVMGLEGYLWSDGYLWSNGYLWSDGYLWTDALTETAGVNFWVSQE